jgi:hypothetical protein
MSMRWSWSCADKLRRGLMWALGLCAASCAAAEGEAAASGKIGDCPPDHPLSFTLGYGRTFNFYYMLSGAVVPATLTWSCDRYELGVFWFHSQDQNVFGVPIVVARKDLATSLSRRWYLHRWDETGVFIGLGASYRTLAGPSEGNALNGSHLNFAGQLGVRWTGGDHRPGLELSIRHFSNAGIVRPNKGQNFVDLALVF